MTSRTVRWSLRFVLATLGVGVAVGAAELVFRARDDAAFPHLNVYVADSALAVRLRPDAEQRVRFGSAANPITSVHIGPEGYREPLPPPTPGDVLIVGDSQVFGLGVEADQTFSHRLRAHLGGDTRVANLGVPTYGPDEYLAVLEAALQTRKPRAIVFAVNMVNDLFEATRPNLQRHAVLDGWAIRKERMPASSFPLPYREILLGRSHLVYALRRSGEAAPALASEGGYQDLLGIARETTLAEQKARDDYERGSRGHSAIEDAAYLEFARLDAALHRTLFDKVKCFGQYVSDGHDQYAGLTDEFACGRLDPTLKAGAEVELYPNAEESRPIRVTAEHLKRAAWMRAYLDDNQSAIAEVEHIPAVKAAADKRNAARDEYYALRGERPRYEPTSTPLSPALEKLASLAKAHSTRAVVLVLPIDVAVSSTEWAKYGQPATLDMAAVNAFSTAVVAQSKALGLEALDATPLLAAAEPGAFLDADIHMTPKGHDAVAVGLAAVLNAAPKLPEATSRPHRQMGGVTYADLRSSYELSHRGCRTFRAPDAQLTLACPLTVLESIVDTSIGGGAALDGVTVLDHDASDVLAGTVGSFALIHVADEKPVHFLLFHGERTRAVSVHDQRGLIETKAELLTAKTAPPHTLLTTSDPRFLACAQARPHDELGPSDADCIRTYEGSCQLMLACSRGADYAQPRCAEGMAPSGKYARCARGVAP